MRTLSLSLSTITLRSAGPNSLLMLLNRPSKLNAFDNAMWSDLARAFDAAAADPDVRAIVIAGEGKCFSAGIDLEVMKGLAAVGQNLDPSRRAYALGAKIKQFQDVFTRIETAPQPVIASIHGYCFGAGVDLISAADIRWAHPSSVFSIKEVDVGICADVGTLQRLPKIVGNQSMARELIYTGRTFSAYEAMQLGLISRITNEHDTKSFGLDSAIELANELAQKSPIAIAGSKRSLNYSRDRPVSDGLHDVAMWNMSMLASEDILKAVTKSKDGFRNLPLGEPEHSAPPSKKGNSS